MAASLRSARSVAKAMLPNRMGRTIYRLSGPILTVNRGYDIPFKLTWPVKLECKRFWPGCEGYEI
jgi:hypothetical protein